MPAPATLRRLLQPRQSNVGDCVRYYDFDSGTDIVPDRSRYHAYGLNVGGVYTTGAYGRALKLANALNTDAQHVDCGASLNFGRDYDSHMPTLTAAAGDQGLTADNEYWYWGQNHGDALPGSVYKIDNSGTVVATFDAPPHAAGGDWREDHDTLLFSSGGGVVPEVWEIDKATGAKVRGWDFTGVDYGQGALVAWVSGDSIYLFTSDATNKIKIRAVTVNDDGTFTPGDVWASNSLGLPQGLDCKDGSLYYLTDYSAGVKLISMLTLNVGGTITVARAWMIQNANESEGLTFRGESLYYGDVTHTIYRTTCPADPARGFTIATWCQAAAGEPRHAYNALISKGSPISGSDQYLLYAVAEATYKYRFGVTLSTNAWKTATSLEVVSAFPAWDRLVGVWDGSFVSIYRNGVLQATTEAFGGLLNDYGANTLIGCDLESGVIRDGWNGLLDGVEMWKRPLSGVEITADFDAQKAAYGL